MEQLSFEKERIQNIALYFVQHSEKVGITKLCKLFYFFDMDVYKDVGFTASGLTYYAKKQGPVPMSVWAELQDKKIEKYKYFDLNKVIRREPKRTSRSGQDERYFIPKRNAEFQSEYLSPKEIKILETIVEKYKNSTGCAMAEESHLLGKPWEQTWADGMGDGRPIDFDLEATLYYDTDDMEYRRRVQKDINEFKVAVAAL